MRARHGKGEHHSLEGVQSDVLGRASMQEVRAEPHMAQRSGSPMALAKYLRKRRLLRAVRRGRHKREMDRIFTHDDGTRCSIEVGNPCYQCFPEDAPRYY